MLVGRRKKRDADWNFRPALIRPWPSHEQDEEGNGEVHRNDDLQLQLDAARKGSGELENEKVEKTKIGEQERSMASTGR